MIYNLERMRVVGIRFVDKSAVVLGYSAGGLVLATSLSKKNPARYEFVTGEGSE